MKRRKKKQVALCCDCKRRQRIYDQTGLMIKPRVPFSYNRVGKVGEPEAFLPPPKKKRARRRKDIESWIKAQLQ